MNITTLLFFGIQLLSIIICAVMLMEYMRLRRTRIMLLERLQGKPALLKDKGGYMFFMTYVVMTIAIFLGSACILFLPAFA